MKTNFSRKSIVSDLITAAGQFAANPSVIFERPFKSTTEEVMTEAVDYVREEVTHGETYDNAISAAVDIFVTPRIQSVEWDKGC